MQAAVPYLIFAGNTEEAFRHYHALLGGELSDIVRFRDIGVAEPEEQAEKVAHVTLTLGEGVMLMGSDTMAGQPVQQGDNVIIMLEPDSADEAERMFAALADGGKVQMELQGTPWAEKHGSCTDRYGMSWMINYTGGAGSGMAG